jgi:ERF superfamily protein
MMKLETTADAAEPRPMQMVPAALTPLAMIDKAISNGAGIETIERLVALHERWKAGEAERAFDEAMSAAQSEIRTVAWNANNSQTKSRYATYQALDAEVRPIYTKHGFVVSFDTGEGAAPECVRVLCKIGHKAGHRETRHIDMPADGKGAKGGDVMTKTHATGSAITYGRRYLLSMIFNIAAGEIDDDGNGAGSSSDAPKTVDAAQARYIADLLEQSGSDEAKMLAYVKAESIEAMTQKQFKMAEAAMRKKIATTAPAGGK